MIIVGGQHIGGVYQDQPPPPPWVTSGLVVFLDAEMSASYPGTGTTWYDLSGYNNNVTMQNSGSITYTSSGGGYFTTGSNGYFSRPAGSSSIPTGGNPYTLSVWVQLGSIWSAQGFIGIGDGYGTVDAVNAFRSEGTNNLLNYWWGNDFGQSFSPTSSSAWMNVIASYDGNTRTLWANGNSIGSQSILGLNVTDNYLSIGLTWPSGSEYLNGNIGQAMIYNRALTSPEVTQNFNYFRTRYGV